MLTKRQMRVVVIGRSLPSPRTGMIGLFELAQARALDAAGVEVVYCFVDVRSIRTFRFPRKVSTLDSESGVQILGFDIPINGLPKGVVRRARTAAYARLFKEIRRKIGRIDAVYVQFPLLTMTAAFADFLESEGIPFAILEHQGRVQWLRLSQEERELFEHAAVKSSGLAAVSQDLKESMERLLRGFDAPDVRVIPNAVTVPASLAPGAVPGVTPGPCRLRFISTSHLTPEKNHDRTLRAFASVYRSNPEAHMTFIGGGGEEASLRALAEELGILSGVSFLGVLPHDETLAHLASADCLISGAASETFGVPTVEAWMLGVPVIASDTGPLRDWFEASNGLLFDDSDEESLSSAMRVAASGSASFDPVVMARKANDSFGSSHVGRLAASFLREIQGSP